MSVTHAATTAAYNKPTSLPNPLQVYLPISAITATSPRRMNPRGRTYERVLQITGQPDPLSDPAVAAAWKSTSAPKDSS